MPLVRRDAPCALPLEKKVERRRTRPQITGGRPQISRQFSPKWTEREILPKIPSRMEHEMLTKMDGEEVKGSPKARTEIGHRKITLRRTEIQVAQERADLVENLVENWRKEWKGTRKVRESRGFQGEWQPPVHRDASKQDLRQQQGYWRSRQGQIQRIQHPFQHLQQQRSRR